MVVQEYFYSRWLCKKKIVALHDKDGGAYAIPRYQHLIEILEQVQYLSYYWS